MALVCNLLEVHIIPQLHVLCVDAEDLKAACWETQGREGWREGRREGRRDGRRGRGRDGGRDGGKDGGRDGGRDGERDEETKGGMERRKEGGKEGQRERQRERGRQRERDGVMEGGMEAVEEGGADRGTEAREREEGREDTEYPVQTLSDTHVLLYKPVASGMPMSTSRSNRPNLRRAGSTLLGRLVAAMTITCARCLSPSMSVSSWETIRLSTSP